ncbi:MAG: FAD-dependent monooxygenase [Pyrinomonadaceae bacterium]
MIRDIAELADGTTLQAEVGIVGAGFAGIELARYLGRHGVQVVLLESGRSDFDPETQKLARVDSVGKLLRTPDPNSSFTPYLPPIFRGETRLGQFGGTSNIWTGKWRMYDSLTFVKRPWVPYSGWPFGLEELQPFYDEVARDYGLEDFAAFARSAANETKRKALGAAGLKLSFHFWEKETTRLAKRFSQGLQQAPTVDVLLGANATETVLDDNLERVQAMRFQSLDGRRFTLVASYFVLATGGLEVARLLLASDRQMAAGIGNRHGMVGRFFMGHPKHKRGTLRPGRAIKLISGQTATQPRPGFQANFSLSDDVQQRQALLNHTIRFTPVTRWVIRLSASMRLRQPCGRRNRGGYYRRHWRF